MDKKIDDSAPTVSATDGKHPIPTALRDAFDAIESNSPSSNGMQVFTQMRTVVQSYFQSGKHDTAPTPPTSAADAERLDALEAFEGKGQWIVAKGIDSFTVYLKPHHYATRRTLREAIDAASKGSSNG